MNILYCGDENTEEGLILSVLSLAGKINEPLNIIVLTMSLHTKQKTYKPVKEKTLRFLEEYLREKNTKHSVRLIDAGEVFQRIPPKANMDTRFTPYCMLRLYADLIPDIPDRILYLDNDVICRRDCSAFYYQSMEGHELAGVLDYYGKWFFRNRPAHMDYLNSGVLLLNMKEIRRTGLFEKCRECCRDKRMFMPDQSAINKLAVSKKICPGRFNDQRRLNPGTVLQHFTTSFRFFPWLHTVTVKPWQIDEVHRKLKIEEYDDLFEEYHCFMKKIKSKEEKAEKYEK